MPVTIDGTSGITSPAIDLTTTPLAVADGGTGLTTGENMFRNRIINGAMMISQRGTSFSTPSNGSYTIDRWLVGWGGAAPASVSQVAGISGFKNAIQITGAASNTGAFILQRIESSNCSDLSGISVTIQANISVSIAQTVLWQLSYANSSDNFSAVTSIATGTWSATTTATLFNATISNLPASSVNGLQLVFYPNNGSSFTSGTMTVTGVQLEKGSTATSFDYRPYGTELALCQRYFISYGGSDAYEVIAGGLAQSTTSSVIIMSLPVEMRTQPTLGFNATNAFLINDSSVQNASSAIALQTGVGTKNLGVAFTTSGITAGRATRLLANNSTAARLTFSAEL